MSLAAGIALLVVVAAAIVFAIRSLRRPVSVSVDVAPRDVLELEPEPIESEPIEPEPEPAWTAELTTAVLDEDARLHLIDDLALLAAPWATALLRRAHEEEQSAQVRARIEAAFASSGEPVTGLATMTSEIS